MNNEIIFHQLSEIVSSKNMITSQEKMIDYSHDENSLREFVNKPDFVIFPKTTGQVSQILSLCNREKIPVTPRGSGTGLCGGCSPAHGGGVLSLEKMDQMIEFDLKNQLITAQSGMRLLDIYSVIEKKGLFFAPHPGDSSASLGGIIATNAGGSRAVKYGVTREYVKAIEAVLPDGQIINIGGKYQKSSSGYSLLHLMIGSEGTLGIITQATIQLIPKPACSMCLVVAFEKLNHAIQSVPIILRNQIEPISLEFIGLDAITPGCAYLGAKWPIPRGKHFLMILIDADNEELLYQKAEKIDHLCAETQAIETFITEDLKKQQMILKIRSSLYDTLKEHLLEDIDICVPRSEIANFVNDIEQLSKQYQVWLPTYGHAGDGNVHIHIMNADWNQGKWVFNNLQDSSLLSKLKKEIYKLGTKYHGICSGEHGIGLAKKEYLNLYLSQIEIEIMKKIKKDFDPNNILNPGKIF